MESLTDKSEKSQATLPERHHNKHSTSDINSGPSEVPRRCFCHLPDMTKMVGGAGWPRTFLCTWPNGSQLMLA